MHRCHRLLGPCSAQNAGQLPALPLLPSHPRPRGTLLLSSPLSLSQGSLKVCHCFTLWDIWRGEYPPPMLQPFPSAALLQIPASPAPPIGSFAKIPSPGSIFK